MVGARELKTRLGTYLRRVREGRRILVTDRGIAVAELRGVGAEQRDPRGAAPAAGSGEAWSAGPLGARSSSPCGR